MKRTWGIARAVAVLAAMVLLGGCGNKVTMRQFPARYDPGIRTIAVAPFVNESLEPRAGQFVASRVAAALSANGTYAVVGPREFERRLQAAGQTLVEGAGPREVAKEAGALEGVQAVLVGTVGMLGGDQQTYVDYDYFYRPYYYYGYHRHPFGYHGYGFGGYAARYDSYATAVVAAGAQLVRVPGGETILSMPGGNVGRRVSSSYRTVTEVMHSVVDRLAADMVKAFAVTSREVTVDGGKALRLSRRAAGGPRQFTDKFGGGDDIVAVVQLPPEAARNEFQLTISRKDGAPLAERVFTWRWGEYEMEFTFDAGTVAKWGTGRFRVLLLLGGQEAAHRDFRITSPG